MFLAQAPDAEFEKYDTTAQHYSSTRVPVGTLFILKTLAKDEKTLAEKTILDAGCGTGNYIGVLHQKVGQIIGVDRNGGMLTEARRRFADMSNVKIVEGNVCVLPVEDSSIDAVLSNQVLHHLDQPKGGEKGFAFPNAKTFISEAHRVLRPDGTLIINISSHQQVTESFWYMSLIPGALAELISRLPPVLLLIAMCQEAGFVDVMSQTETEILQGEAYLDPAGPLREKWRAGDSTWALAIKEELASALELAKNQEDMKLRIIAAEEWRKEIGQSTFIVARKPR